MTAIEVNYIAKKTYCDCCNRPLDKFETRDKSGTLDLSEMIQYAPTGDGEAFIEDLYEFVGGYLIEYYGEYLYRDEIAYFSQEEEKKVLDAFCSLLQSEGYSLI